MAADAFKTLFLKLSVQEEHLSQFSLNPWPFDKKMEQLILYVKALKTLNLSLLFAQAEIRQGHLKPSNAVKNGKL
ncbi:hypothetical protein P5673_019412 [Acropora cervicornis]|uniref:Uncharacterized protein n=1 Tax=Acropora cervicornis TaxID=6130 RepID=A0AAD9V2F3_ACRCE|nr:hypothetical protein P5673_019412 [Acropora cervicornis]